MFNLYQRYSIDTEVQRDCGDTIIQSADGAVTKVPFGQLPVRDFMFPNVCPSIDGQFIRGTQSCCSVCWTCFKLNAH
jgi:hypothetical protein